MKLASLALVIAMTALAGCAPEASVSSSPSEAALSPKILALCGLYRWEVPGSTTELWLKTSGDYEMTTYGCSTGLRQVSYQERGKWKRAGLDIILDATSSPVSPAFGSCRRLTPNGNPVVKETHLSRSGSGNGQGEFLKIPIQATPKTESTGANSSKTSPSIATQPPGAHYAASP